MKTTNCGQFIPFGVSKRECFGETKYHFRIPLGRRIEERYDPVYDAHRRGAWGRVLGMSFQKAKGRVILEFGVFSYLVKPA